MGTPFNGIGALWLDLVQLFTVLAEDGHALVEVALASFTGDHGGVAATLAVELIKIDHFPYPPETISQGRI